MSTYEHDRAMLEGQEVAASDLYFAARHEMLDTKDRRNVFKAGFERGWRVKEALAQPVAAAQPPAPCMNTWFTSLPEGRQAVLRDDKWMLAHAAFEAGFAEHAARSTAAQPVAAEPAYIAIDGAVFHEDSVSLIRRGYEDGYIARHPGAGRVYRLAPTPA